MPKRPPSLTERLRTAWSAASNEMAHATPGEGTSPARSGSRGTEFADRLRAAVTARR